MNEITNKHDLLDENGKLIENGYSRKMLLNYNRKNIGVSKLKIKEWDYYLIQNNIYAIALTVADNAYMGLLSVSVIDFELKKEKTKTIMTMFPRGKLNFNEDYSKHINMPENSKTGNIFVKTKKCDFRFIHDGANRSLYCYFKNFYNKQDLEATLYLTSEPKESMVIATPFKEDEKAFYYNQKIIGFKANGKVKIGDHEIKFKPTNSFGLLDWGRGVWTYKNTWYWGAAMGKINEDTLVGFNIGYGFGDTSNATENMFFYNGKAHKLEDVTFNIPLNKKGKEDFLRPWTFTSNNKKFEINFTPILNRHSDTNVLILRSNQNQIFGYFSGFAILEDGTKVEINNLLGFAEKVFNKW